MIFLTGRESLCLVVTMTGCWQTNQERVCKYLDKWYLSNS